MKRGPKPKQNTATGSASKPIMPDYLSAEAQDVWFEELERVVAHGINADYSSTFARYCSMEAVCRSIFAKGEMPRGAYTTEVRKLSELLGISGLSGRVSTGTTDPLNPAANPFAALPDA